MQHYFLNNIWMVPVYPLIAAVIILICRSLDLYRAKEISMGLVVGSTFLGFLHAVAACFWLFAQDPTHTVFVEKNLEWLHAGPFTFSVGYLLDSMSVMMLVVVTFISMLIQIYTHGYMEKDPGYSKFYIYLALFNFSMLGLVLSTNLFQMYIFWELVGVCSYLLIGFWFTRPAAAKACVKAFLMNRVGDFGLLLGILAFLYCSMGWWQSYLSHNPGTSLLSFHAFALAAPHVLVVAGPGLFTLIAFLILMGPMAKSAQVPLHTWLPDAMEGPTPISALIHAATMVAAGIYLVGRVYPIFQVSPSATAIVAVIGALTAFIGATIALTQTDIKKALAYSTMSQLGFMMTAMGVGAFAAGLFHLFTHAFFKAMLFLCSGSVIHACEDEQDMRKMGGLWSKLPITAWTYLIGTIAISGLIWFSGFWSKDMILEGAKEYAFPIFALLVLTAFMTAFYMFRTFFLTFTGSYRGSAHVHHESKVMVYPLVVLAVPSILIGAMLSGVAPFEHWPVFSAYIQPPDITPVVMGMFHASSGGGHGAAVHHGAWISEIGILSLGIGFAGVALAFLLYGPKPIMNLEQFKQKPVIASLNRLFSRKWYFDELYAGFVEKIYLVFAKASARFDSGSIDGVVNWTGRSVSSSGAALKELQTGRVQTYIAVIFYAILVLSLLFIYSLL